MVYVDTMTRWQLAIAWGELNMGGWPAGFLSEPEPMNGNLRGPRRDALMTAIEQVAGEDACKLAWAMRYQFGLKYPEAV